MRNWSMVIMVRSAFGDREYSSILLATGSPTAVGKPAAIQSWIRLGGSYFQLSKTGICNNFEKSIFTKIVSSKDPPWRIESCIAPGLPTNGRWTWGKAVRLFRTTRLGGLTYRNQFDLPKADQFILIILIKKNGIRHTAAIIFEIPQ